jgi:hypothetical protein
LNTSELGPDSSAHERCKGQESIPCSETAALGISDQQRLAQGFPVYDALLQYARDLEGSYATAASQRSSTRTA